jgi:hypothetical protein
LCSFVHFSAQYWQRPLALLKAFKERHLSSAEEALAASEDLLSSAGNIDGLNWRGGADGEVSSCLK